MPLRRGRKRYIVASFVITVLSSFNASFDMAIYFQTLFKSTSPSHWYRLWQLSFLDWKFFVSNIAVGLFIGFGDALLVGCASVLNFCLSGNTNNMFVAGLSLLYHVRGL